MRQIESQADLLGQRYFPKADEAAPLARVVSAEFQGDDTDVPIVREALIEAIAKVADVTDVAGDVHDTRLSLAAGARIQLITSVPAQPEAHPTGTITVTAVLHDTAGLPPDQVTKLLAAARRVPFTPTEMAELRRQMPLTAELPLFLPPDCLSGVAPVLTVHHMTDFLMLVEAVRAMGVPPEAITVIDKQYCYRHTDRVDAHLTRQEIAIWPWTKTAQALDAHTRRAATLGRHGLLIDDGGYTLPVLLTHRPDLLPYFGGLVEQTISGITRLESWPELPLPIFSVAESRLKATIESYGIADAAIRNVLQLLPQEKLEGQPALVIGYGRIGEQIAAVLTSRRMRVAVYDQQIVRLIAAHERGYHTARCLSTLLRQHKPVLVVGSTGRTSLRGEHAAAISRDCYLVSTTSRDREFAIAELTDEATRVIDEGVVGTQLRLRSGANVTLVGGGLPINFHFAESLPNSYADLILASLLVGAATLATPEHGFAPGHNVAATDRALEGCGLLERYYDRFGPR
ncbi:NAD(P)-dependent oxidoreductase [Nonomuraea sp. NPDC046802]|uniref:NAD(P)-dependent oxidoreductase n=1 Tax=Nonomuraea sp. NPDC046802 TaxID=3154919 RepID=UPI0033C24A84